MIDVVVTSLVLSATPIRIEDVRQEARNNVQALLSEYDRVKASANTVNVRSGTLPQLQLNASGGYSLQGKQRIVEPYPDLKTGAVSLKVVDIPATETYNGPQFNFGVTLNQVIFDWGRWQQIAQAGWQEDAARGTAQENMDFAEFEGVRRFFVLFTAQRTLTVLEATAVRSQQLVERAQALFTAGRGSKSDVLAAQVNLNNDRINAQRQRTTITQASADLSGWLARSETEELEAVEPSNYAQVPAGPPELTQEVELARSHRPLLRFAQSQVTAANAGINAANSGYIPRLNAQVQYSRPGEGINPVFTDWRTQNNLAAGAYLTWDLFSGFATVSAVESARAIKSQAVLTLEQDIRDVEGQVRIARTTLEVNLAVFQIAKDNQVTAGQGLTAAQARFNAGAGSTLEVRDAELKVVQAEVTLLQARADVETAQAALARVTGTIGSSGSGS